MTEEMDRKEKMIRERRRRRRSFYSSVPGVDHQIKDGRRKEIHEEKKKDIDLVELH